VEDPPSQLGLEKRAPEDEAMANPFFLFCALGLHKPSQSHSGKARHDIVTQCTHCGRKLIKWRGKSKWKTSRSRAKKKRTTAGRG
jgi:hypothetical protein